MDELSARPGSRPRQMPGLAILSQPRQSFDPGPGPGNTVVVPAPTPAKLQKSAGIVPGILLMIYLESVSRKNWSAVFWAIL